MDFIAYFWIIKNTTAERTAVSLHVWGAGIFLRIMTRCFGKLLDIQTSKILIAGKCFVSYPFWDIRSWIGEKDKTPWAHGSFQNSTRRIKHTVQDHIKLIQLLRKRTTKGGFLAWSKKKKNHKRHLSYQQNVLTTDDYSTLDNHIQHTPQLPFSYVFLV